MTRAVFWVSAAILAAAVAGYAASQDDASPPDDAVRAELHDLRARDAAYHQGTVWAWLMGPFVDAWLKVHPEQTAEAHELLLGFNEHIDEACVGSISEVFDAESPYLPRGCIAQAWSVAEVLRCLVKTGAGAANDHSNGRREFVVA